MQIHSAVVKIFDATWKNVTKLEGVVLQLSLRIPPPPPPSPGYIRSAISYKTNFNARQNNNNYLLCRTHEAQLPDTFGLVNRS